MCHCRHELAAFTAAWPIGVRVARAMTLGALTLGAVGCSAGPASDGVSVSDSAGVRIVESHTPARTGTFITVNETPKVTIGSASGDEAQELFQVRSAYHLDDGRLLVLNASELRFYDVDGSHVRTVGGAGSGPGEFSGPRWAAFRGDTIIVYDPFQDNGRVSYFTSDGDFLSDARVTVAGLDYPSPNAMLPDGSYVSERSEGSVDWTEEGYVSYTRAIIRYPRDGSRVDTIAMTTGGEMFREEFRGGMSQWDVPFGRRALTALHEDRVFVSDGHELVVDVFDVDGSHVSSLRSSVAARPVGDAEVKQWIDATLASPFYESRPEAAVRVRERYEKTPASPEMPAFDRMLADAAGRLWVRLFVPPWENGSTWRVFDTEGRWLSDVDLPTDLEVYEIGTDYVLGKRTDELGVEYVQMHALSVHSES